MNLFEILLFVFGLVLLGPFINFAIYAFAYFPRQISPWQSPIDGVPARTVLNRIPVMGWLTRSELESKSFGRWYWFRPLAIELLTPIALVMLYRFCIDGAFMQPGLPAIPLATLQYQCVAFASLIAFMVVATFIDFDERTIPDLVTIPGTLLGMVGALIVPDWRLHDSIPPVFPALQGSTVPLHANSPFAWDLSWNGLNGLWIGLFFWSGWCFAIADRRWISRRGTAKAFEYFFEALRRNPSSKFLLVMWIIGLIGITAAYAFVGPNQWEALLSSLFGIGLGGVLVWGFRIVARMALGQEALGFGDVTLMAMVGSFFGWQIVWLAFFMAPLFGMLIVVISYFATGDNSTPFGPYLCAATLYAMLDWVRLWDWFSGAFMVFMPQGFLMPLFGVMLFVMGGLLWGVHQVKLKMISE